MTGTSLLSRQGCHTEQQTVNLPSLFCNDELSNALLWQVTLGQKKGQAMRVVSRCLWDTHSDSSASELYENETLYCVCQVSPWPMQTPHFVFATVVYIGNNSFFMCLQVYGLYYE